jgi:hypothetical protein
MSLFLGNVNDFVVGVMGQLREINNIDAYEELHACLSIYLRTHKEQKKNKQKYLDKIMEEINCKMNELCNESGCECCVYITSLIANSGKLHDNSEHELYHCTIECTENDANMYINFTDNYSFEIDIDDIVYGSCYFHTLKKDKNMTIVSNFESNFESNFVWNVKDYEKLDDVIKTQLKLCAQIGQFIWNMV